ncbi:MAG: hypothetical protein IPK72_21580 [Candidatus Eisenbacteria bacterium]|nr:hypothetical protein [Candidatus Eisenbacteria bacterium]
MVYALLAAAYGRATGQADILPDGLMLDAPEMGRLRVRRGEPFAMGFTLLADESDRAEEVLTLVVEGLGAVGSERPERPLVFAGNFEITGVEDLVRGREWAPGRPLECIPRERIEAEAMSAARLSELTLRFVTPLKMMRPKPLREPGAECFDARFFDPGLFVIRTMRRLHELGLRSAPTGSDIASGRSIEVSRLSLVWMDFAYGGPRRLKLFAGALGRVRLHGLHPAQAGALAWGQHARVGQSTRFGQGAYRIDELGHDPFECRRSAGLLDHALSGGELDEAASHYELGAGVLRRAARQVREGRYEPKPVYRVPIVQADGRQRVLAIPTRLDRALQRTILTHLAPAMDKLLEEASIAYRRGLGRASAATRVRRAFEEGYRFGLRADFRRFFDSIDHTLLRDRLDACLSDDATADLLMRWVRSGSPRPDCGVPTGAPISPLLANLFLDQYDEEISAEGGRLIRYADDFLVLYRTQAEADAVFETATKAAQALALELNESKTRHVDLGAFDFLGYRFERRDRWVAEATGGPRRIEEIGWREASRPAPESSWALLPGETEAASPDDLSWVIVGPGASHLTADGAELRCAYGDGRETRVSLERVHELLVLGRPTLSGPAISWLLRHDRRVPSPTTVGMWWRGSPPLIRSNRPRPWPGRWPSRRTNRGSSASRGCCCPRRSPTTPRWPRPPSHTPTDRSPPPCGRWPIARLRRGRSNRSGASRAPRQRGGTTPSARASPPGAPSPGESRPTRRTPPTACSISR